MFWDIVIIAGIFWIIMSFFSFLQSTHIKNIYKMLERTKNTVYFGRDAGFLRTRTFVFAAIDNSGMIVDSRRLKASILVTIPKTLPFDFLIGKNINEIDPLKINTDANGIKAVTNLIDNYKKYSQRKKNK